MKTHDIVTTALFAAVISLISLISIPTPLGVPLTLQTFAVALCGYTLGDKRAVASTAVYIAVGLLGVPVFSGAQGGFGVLLSPTGGFIIGFIPLSLLSGISGGNEKLRILFGIIGLLICHIIGTVQFSLVSGADIIGSFVFISLPYLAKDTVLVIAAYFISKRLKTAVEKSTNR